MDFLDINLSDISTDINNENVQLFVRRFLEPVHYKTLVAHFCRSYHVLAQRATAMSSLNSILVASINEGKIIHYNNHFYADTHAEDMQRFIDLHERASGNNKKTNDITNEEIKINQADETEEKGKEPGDEDTKKKENENDDVGAKKVEIDVNANDIDGEGALDGDSGESNSELKVSPSAATIPKAASSTMAADSVKKTD